MVEEVFLPDVLVFFAIKKLFKDYEYRCI